VLDLDCERRVLIIVAFEHITVDFPLTSFFRQLLQVDMFHGMFVVFVRSSIHVNLQESTTFLAFLYAIIDFSMENPKQHEKHIIL